MIKMSVNIIEYPNTSVRYNVFASQGAFMVWDWQATYDCGFGVQTGDFLRDAAGIAMTYRDARVAAWLCEESEGKNFPPAHTVA
jgi:hypothetical protein